MWRWVILPVLMFIFIVQGMWRSWFSELTQTPDRLFSVYSMMVLRSGMRFASVIVPFDRKLAVDGGILSLCLIDSHVLPGKIDFSLEEFCLCISFVVPTKY